LSDHQFLDFVEQQSPAVAEALGQYRLRAAEPEPSQLLDDIAGEQFPDPDVRFSRYEIRVAQRRGARAGCMLLIAAAVTVTAAAIPVSREFISAHWPQLVVAGASLSTGAALILVCHGATSSPLRTLEPPTSRTDQPLHELETLARRSADRLHKSFRLQIGAVVVVGLSLLALLTWAAVLVSTERLGYGVAFGSGGIGMIVLGWRWQPFDRIEQARRLAENADALATGLRVRMASIAEIKGANARAKAQWQAVRDFLGESGDRRGR